MAEESIQSILPAKVILAAGTYDGVLAGYELKLYDKKNASRDEDDASHDDDDDDDDGNQPNNKLKIVFASPVHGGSVRSLTMSSHSNQSDDSSSCSSSSCLLLSTGYDEMLKTHDFGKRLTSSGEVRTPADFGTPVCSAFAPPHGGGGMSSSSGGSGSTHCLVGFGSSAGNETAASGTGGKLVIYKKRDWSVQHVLNGHDGGVASVAVHPTGKLALTGGIQDGKLKLWDLERGRLAYSSPTIKAAATQVQGRKHYDSIVSIVWSDEGDCYAFCHGSHITVRDVATGKNLLDVELPSKVNQVCLMRGPEGLFVAAAGNDGSLPVLAVENVDDNESERRAMMAIEPVDGPVAGDERFKCIQTVTGYYVATANSGGVVSLMNLQGSISMITSPQSSNEDDEEKPVHSESDDDDDVDDKVEEEEELAVDIVDSILLGSGARITCLAAWAAPLETPPKEILESEVVNNKKEERKLDVLEDAKRTNNRKHKRDETKKVAVMDSETLEKARALVSQAKKIQKRKSKKGKRQKLTTS